eukprot:365477-Chlamydomonas_euryale.AAC.11
MLLHTTSRPLCSGHGIKGGSNLFQKTATTGNSWQLSNLADNCLQQPSAKGSIQQHLSKCSPPLVPHPSQLSPGQHTPFIGAAAPGTTVHAPPSAAAVLPVLHCCPSVQQDTTCVPSYHVITIRLLQRCKVTLTCGFDPAWGLVSATKYMTAACHNLPGNSRQQAA